MDTTQIGSSWLNYTDSTMFAASEPSLTGSIITIIVSLCFILGIFFLIMAIIKKYGKRGYFDKFIGKETDSSIKIVSKLFLGYKKYLYVIELNSQHLLIGVTENNINLLSKSVHHFASELKKEENT